MQATQPASPRLSRIVLLVTAIVVTFIGCHFARVWLSASTDKASAASEQTAKYQRIIGLSPSIVEIIYQLEQADRLVGVSRFCKHPPEARQKTVVGGYVDLDFEAVLKLEPDCVVLLEEQQALAEKLESMGIHTILVDHASPTGIIESISVLGNAFHKETLAKEIVKTMHSRISKVSTREQTTDQKPRILVCIDRDTSSTFPDRIIGAGNKGVHQEYIHIAGGINAYQGLIAYPRLSREKLLHLNPDIIIELIRKDVWQEKGHDQLIQQWQAYGELKAVQSGRIIFLHENKHMIPGPRFIDTLEVFAQAVNSHPK